MMDTRLGRRRPLLGFRREPEGPRGQHRLHSRGPEGLRVCQGVAPWCPGGLPPRRRGWKRGLPSRSDARELAALQSNLVIDANVFRACLENKVKDHSLCVERLGIPLRPAARCPRPFQGGGLGAGEPGGRVRVGQVHRGEAARPDARHLLRIARIFHAYGENLYLRPDRSQVIASLIREGGEVSQGGLRRLGRRKPEAVLRLRRRCNRCPDEALGPTSRSAVA